MNLTQFAEWLIEAYHSDDGMPEAKEICREARAALSAQPARFITRSETPAPAPDPSDSAGAMAAAWFGTPGTEKAVNAVFGPRGAKPAPSAQGESVACVTEEMVTAYLTANDAYWKRIDGEPTKIGKWRNGTPSEATRVSLMAALASAPSSPAPAVVEAVPLNFDQLQSVMSQHFGGRELTDDEADSAEAFARAIERAHGIAPKAAQEKP